MIALDTNILVRFLTRDDPEQAQRVYRRFQKAESSRETLFVAFLVVQELVWVLESAYDYGKDEILDAVADLSQLRFLRFEREALLQRFLTEGRRPATDLSDLLIELVSADLGCTEGMSFDRKATKRGFFRLPA